MIVVLVVPVVVAASYDVASYLKARSAWSALPAEEKYASPKPEFDWGLALWRLSAGVLSGLLSVLGVNTSGGSNE